MIFPWNRNMFLPILGQLEFKEHMSSHSLPFSENLRNIFVHISSHSLPLFFPQYLHPVTPSSNHVTPFFNPKICFFTESKTKHREKREKPSTSTRHLPVDWSWNVQNHHQHQQRFEAKHRNHSGPMKPDIRRTSPPNWMGQWPAKLFGENHENHPGRWN